eukprot:6577141-Alexandrium_andersonii.AAC.1
MRKIRRLARFLKGCGDIHLHFPREPAADELSVYVDSDWAGEFDRKSVSGGVIMAGGCQLASWSRTQGATSLSSGEAEFYAISLGVTESLGLRNILHSVGIDLPIKIYSDSSAGRAMCHRLGAGNHMKHVEVRHFHVQRLVRDKVIEVDVVRGDSNPADLGTKAVEKA